MARRRSGGGSRQLSCVIRIVTARFAELTLNFAALIRRDLPQQSIQLAAEFISRERRLDDEVIGTGSDCGEYRFTTGVRGQYDHLDLREDRVSSKSFQRLDAIPAWHLNIEDR